MEPPPHVKFYQPQHVPTASLRSMNMQTYQTPIDMGQTSQLRSISGGEYVEIPSTTLMVPTVLGNYVTTSQVATSKIGTTGTNISQTDIYSSLFPIQQTNMVGTTTQTTQQLRNTDYTTSEIHATSCHWQNQCFSGKQWKNNGIPSTHLYYRSYHTNYQTSSQLPSSTTFAN